MVDTLCQECFKELVPTHKIKTNNISYGIHRGMFWRLSCECGYYQSFESEYMKAVKYGFYDFFIDDIYIEEARIIRDWHNREEEY